jgi:hypothetical protein
LYPSFGLALDVFVLGSTPLPKHASLPSLC